MNSQYLPFDHYHPEIREALLELADKFPPDSVADAARRLAKDIADHARIKEQHP